MRSCAFSRHIAVARTFPFARRAGCTMNGPVELRETLDVPGLAENCWIGAYSVVFGILRVALAFRLRGQRRQDHMPVARAA